MQDLKGNKVPRGTPEECEITLAPVVEGEDKERIDNGAVAARASGRQADTFEQGNRSTSGHLDLGSVREGGTEVASNRRDASLVIETVSRSAGRCSPPPPPLPRTVKECFIYGLNLIKKWILLPPLYLSGLVRLPHP